MWLKIIQIPSINVRGEGNILIDFFSFLFLYVPTPSGVSCKNQFYWILLVTKEIASEFIPTYDRHV